MRLFSKMRQAQGQKPDCIRMGVEELKAAYEKAVAMGVERVELESVECGMGNAITVYGVDWGIPFGWKRRGEGHNVTNYDNW